MDPKVPPASNPPPVISRGAALAHGCCGAYRPPLREAIVIPLPTAGTAEPQGDTPGETVPSATGEEGG